MEADNPTRGVTFSHADHANLDEAVAFLDVANAMLTVYKRESFQQLRLRPGSHVLDVGCGTGDDVRAMAAIVGPGGRVVGLDNSEEMLEIARSRAGQIPRPVEFIQGDLHQLPFADDSFDACRAERVLEYLEEPSQGLRELIRVTRPGGRIFASNVDKDSMIIDIDDQQLLQKVREFWFTGEELPHLGRQLYRLFRNAGLSDLSVNPQTWVLTGQSLVSDAMTTQLPASAHAAGAISDDEYNRWRRAIDEAVATDRLFVSLTAFNVSGTVEPSP